MGKRSYVALRANPRLGVVVEEGATEGAQIGRDLRLPDGSVPTLAQLAAALGVSEGTARAVLDWDKIPNAPPNVQALQRATGTGLFAVTGAGTGAFRSVTGTSGRIGVTNGSGVAGNPTIDLATVADTGGGSFLLFVRDSWGRVSGTSEGDAGDVPVSSVGWGVLSGSNVQEALDSADIAIQAAGGGGILPVVTGEIVGDQPVFVYLDDGSLVYAEVA